jgi:outer membrane protein assembly factor BamE (lipoprotein component of BamABCDE complex)
MKMKSLKNALMLFTAVAVCAIMTSCGYFSQYSNVEHSQKLRVGMTKQQVLKIMGEPLRNQKYNKPDVWYYYVETQWHDFLTTEDECMPLVFENGKLIGWGCEYYNKMLMEKDKKRSKK